MEPEIAGAMLREMGQANRVKVRSAYDAGDMKLCEGRCHLRMFIQDMSDEELEGASIVLSRMITAGVNTESQIAQVFGHCVEEQIIRERADEFPEVIGEEGDDDRN